MGSATPLSHRHRQHIALLAIAFLLSRALAFRAGMRYLSNETGWLIQLLSLDILRDHLFRGLLHLHAQPPLFNLLIGLALKTGGAHYDWVMLTVQMLGGLAAGIAVYLTLVTLDVDPWFSLFVSLVLLLNPSAILFEFDALYTSLVYAVHCFIALATARYVTTRSTRALACLTALAVSLTLLRSTYPWLWLVCIFGILAWRMAPDRRQILKLGALGLLFAIAWPAKNFILFRHFSSTTWAPYNLSRMWADTPLVLARSPLLPTLAPSDLGEMNPWLEHNWSAPRSGYPELDDIAKATGGHTNWNSLAMLRLHNATVRDDVYLFHHYPGAYVHHVYLASLLYFAPASRYLVLSDMEFWVPSHQLYRDIEPLQHPLDRVCCNPFGYRSASDTTHSHFATLWVHLREVCIGAILIFALVVSCLLSIVFWPDLWNFAPVASGFSQPRETLCLLLGFTILYAFVLTSMLDIGENMRFRHETHALVLIVSAVFVQQMASYRRRRRVVI